MKVGIEEKFCAHCGFIAEHHVVEYIHEISRTCLICQNWHMEKKEMQALESHYELVATVEYPGLSSDHHCIAVVKQTKMIWKQGKQEPSTTFIKLSYPVRDGSPMFSIFDAKELRTGADVILSHYNRQKIEALLRSMYPDAKAVQNS